jgi:hypothetical protein
MKRDSDYFSRLKEYLSPLPGVEKIEVNPVTGSVLVLHSIDLKSVEDLKLVSDYSEMGGLFKIVVPETSSVSLAQGLADAFAGLNEKVKEATAGTVDIPTVAFLVLVGASMVSLSEGVVAVPAITALWYAGSILQHQVRTEKRETQALQAGHA